MESGGRAKNGGGELSLVGIHLIQDIFRHSLADVLASAISDCVKYWSEWQDLNLRPPRPEREDYELNT